MPATLPRSTRTLRELAWREDADGYDTAVVVFFEPEHAPAAPTAEAPVQRARARSSDRLRVPSLLRR